ncbi:MAG: flagellar basal body L-ring protein FlgH [Spirochaetota bacterium]
MKRAVFIILFFSLCVGLYSESIWRDRNIYSSEEEPAIGDIVIVNVQDLSKFKYEIKLNNTSSSEVVSNPDISITGFLPSVSSNKNLKNNETTSFSGNSNMEMSIAATITAVQNNGNVVISGTRAYSFNGVVTTVGVNGVVNPRFISGGSVDSGNVSNFGISIAGRRDGLNIRPAQLEDGGTASAQLPEEEKQRIIIDYLEKIIREITR